MLLAGVLGHHLETDLVVAIGETLLGHGGGGAAGDAVDLGNVQSSLEQRPVLHKC